MFDPDILQGQQVCALDKPSKSSIFYYSSRSFGIDILVYTCGECINRKYDLSLFEQAKNDLTWFQGTVTLSATLKKSQYDTLIRVVYSTSFNACRYNLF